MIGREARQQMLDEMGALPDKVIACVGGGSNAIGIFADFIPDESVELVGVEPAGQGIESGRHGAPLSEGRDGIFFGMKSYMMQDQWGQIQESHSVSAGLDFPSVGPQHAHLKHSGRGTYVSVTDEQALEAFQLLAREEGIIPALESAHALAWAIEQARQDPDKEQNLLINLSGRGDKDIFTVDEILQARKAGKGAAR